ncbi:SRPBCC domain-containing protein [Sphingomonas koreensis]|uniref:SRPBCC domain-containing protein n=1 Tax=Sphingomonas koreensis TaxID=93064 RepID=A0A1L6JB86_9SPHN|nr:SRPBCC domain-containing protein [Sphingomonas koreensis]APR53194.1 hypothetical protein BRX40_12845 [Sphingomonas koreensis]RSU24681.1 SRPBCC domain-containing protein [Sphingomonas koreensis]RSU27050.1 SRPBCC domain-containing protein [Sphingomonas koreensis]RSU29999.1 SRPBCC domain-containing protein [Sphingomonas koreensis]RSU32885.1 SRPBCC domain-containing protein [Sphingomonas koreensis]
MRDSEFIEIVEEYSQPPAIVWRALTDARLLSKWLMPNDFKLAIGHRFTFTGVPIPAVGFDGIVYCEVLDFEIERRLAISWTDGLHADVDWTVTWTLEPTNGGTRLRLFHYGFDPNNERHQVSRRIMSGGWRPALSRLREECVVLATP